MVCFLASKKNTEPVDFERVLRRLDVLIAILLEVGEKNGKPIPIGMRVRILSKAGMRPVEISRILGKSLSYVTKEQALLRKEKRRHEQED